MHPVALGLEAGGTRVMAAHADADEALLLSRQAPTPGSTDSFAATSRGVLGKLWTGTLAVRFP